MYKTQSPSHPKGRESCILLSMICCKTVISHKVLKESYIILDIIININPHSYPIQGAAHIQFCSGRMAIESGVPCRVCRVGFCRSSAGTSRDAQGPPGTQHGCCSDVDETRPHSYSLQGELLIGLMRRISCRELFCQILHLFITK